MLYFLTLLLALALPTMAQWDPWVTEMLNAVNAHRARNNRRPVSLDPRLMSAAAAHSADMARCQRMSHTGCNGSTMAQRITASGYQWGGIAENVAWNQRSVDAVMRAWIASPDHNANMLGDFEHVGFGNSNWYWTQKFARPLRRREGVDETPEVMGEDVMGIADASVEDSAAARWEAWVTEMLNAVNAFRARNNRRPVSLDSRLMSAAAAHSADMARCQRMSHTGCNGSTMAQRITASGYQWGGIAENVAWNQRSVDAVMRAWIASPDHNANMLGDFEHVGFGNSNWYWTQKFARPLRRREGVDETPEVMGEDVMGIADASPPDSVNYYQLFGVIALVLAASSCAVLGYKRRHASKALLFVPAAPIQVATDSPPLPAEGDLYAALL